MPWLNLRRLLAPKKMWKAFTKRMQYKLNISKAIKKQNKIRHHEKTSKKLGWSSLSLRPKKFKLKHNIPRTLIAYQNHLHKIPAPVFIDQLFIESSSTGKQPQIMQPPSAVKEEANTVQKYSSSESNGNSLDHKKKSSSGFGKEVVMSNNDDGNDRHIDDDTATATAADDMWESLVLGSPAQMHGINERAEAFIAQVRADMHRQEMLARRLS